jgi:nucleoside-diphosphate-sugar epimerase
MKVLLVGASGAIGGRLVPQLIDHGHDVIGTCQSPAKMERLRALGAEPVVLDALDRQAVREAVTRAEPDAIVYQATALADMRFGRNFDRTFAQTNRLRTEGTDNLLAAARETGVRRLSPRASPACATRAKAAWSRPRTIPSTPIRRQRCARVTPRCATSSRR